MGELIELLPVDAADEVDQKIMEMRVAGSSVHRVAQELGVPRHEVERRLDRVLPKIDAAFKRRSVACSLLRIDELVEVFHKQAKTGDTESAHIMVRLECEKRALLGIGNGFDPVQLIQQGRDRERSTDAWMRGIEHILSLRADGEADELSEKQ